MNTKRKAGQNVQLNMVLVSDTVFDTNGVSRFIRDIAAHAHRYETSLTVITASPLNTGDLPRNIMNLKPLFAMRMPFYKEQFLNIIPPFFMLYRQIKTLQPEIVHISTPGPMGWSARMIAAMLHIPCAATYHTSFPTILEENTGSRHIAAITKRVMRRFYRPMQFVFSRSKQYLPLLNDEAGITPSRTVLLPSGTDTESFNPAHARARCIWTDYGIGEERIVLLYVGRLNIEKNLLFLVERFKELCATTDKKLALVLIGEGEYEKYAPKWRDQHIHHIGVKKGKKLSQLYASSDLFVSASVTETLGQTVMEAQASGIPAVVSDQGGVTETVMDGETGFTLAVDTPATWVEKLHLLVEDHELRKKMGEAAHTRMQSASILKSCETFFQKHKDAVNTLEKEEIRRSTP